MSTKCDVSRTSVSILTVIVLLAMLTFALWHSANSLAVASAAVGTTQPRPVGRYVISLDGFRIANTRSRGTDTDTVYFGIMVGDKVYPTQERAMGDLNNGTYSVGLTPGPIDISDRTPVVIKYAIVNAGNNHQELNRLVLKAFDDINLEVTKRTDQYVRETYGIQENSVPGISDEDLAKLQNKYNFGRILHRAALDALLTIANPNCDGPVASDVIVTTYGELTKWTARGRHSETRRYNGSDSPAGCGSNSVYYVTWSATRTVQSPPVSLKVSPQVALMDPPTDLQFEADLSAWGTESKEVIFWMEQDTSPTKVRLGTVNTNQRQAPFSCNVQNAKANKGDVRFYVEVTSPSATGMSNRVTVQVTNERPRLPVAVTVNETVARGNTDLRLTADLSAWGTEQKEVAFLMAQQTNPTRWEMGRIYTSEKTAVLTRNLSTTPANQGILEFYVEVSSANAKSESSRVPVRLEVADKTTPILRVSQLVAGQDPAPGTDLRIEVELPQEWGDGPKEIVFFKENPTNKEFARINTRERRAVITRSMSEFAVNKPTLFLYAAVSGAGMNKQSYTVPVKIVSRVVKLSVTPARAKLDPPGTELTFTVEDMPNPQALTVWMEQTTNPQVVELPRQQTTGGRFVWVLNIGKTVANKGPLTFWVEWPDGVSNQVVVVAE